MERAGQSLWGALRRVARPEKPLDLLMAVWPLMVGRRLAGHTRPCAWNKGRVDVAVDDPEWRGQLEGMTRDIRAQINRWWGAELVSEIRFVPDNSKRQSPAENRANPPMKQGSQNRAEVKLGAALKELEPALRGIADAELRELIARVAGQYLGKQEKK